MFSHQSTNKKYLSLYFGNRVQYTYIFDICPFKQYNSSTSIPSGKMMTWFVELYCWDDVNYRAQEQHKFKLVCIRNKWQQSMIQQYKKQREKHVQ